MSQDGIGYMGYLRYIRQKYREYGRCWYCGKHFTEDMYSAGKVHIEHQIPKSMGGSNDKENLVFACEKCNCQKNDSTINEYRQRLRNKMIAKFGNEQKELLRKTYSICSDTWEPPLIVFYGETEHGRSDYR